MEYMIMFITAQHTVAEQHKQNEIDGVGESEIGRLFTANAVVHDCVPVLASQDLCNAVSTHCTLHYLVFSSLLHRRDNAVIIILFRNTFSPFCSVTVWDMLYFTAWKEVVRCAKYVLCNTMSEQLFRPLWMFSWESQYIGQMKCRLACEH